MKQFEENLNKYFDVAHSNALQPMKIEIDKEFLISLRQLGRPGCILGVDMKHTNKEKRKHIWTKIEVSKKQKYYTKYSELAPGNY